MIKKNCLKLQNVSFKRGQKEEFYNNKKLNADVLQSLQAIGCLLCETISFQCVLLQATVVHESLATIVA